jgi:GT2 family glycosyltransferase
MKAITYGPFPGGWPETFAPDFSKIAAAGFNTVRIYAMPDARLLDAAEEYGLKIFGGLQWGQTADFFRSPGILSAAKISLINSLQKIAAHPAFAGVYVGNEIPKDLVRWMGPLKVRQAIEELIDIGKQLAPDLLFAYANYPSTEYLEPENADFTAFNVYLENENAFRSYIKRLHHIAGDRPLVISEIGLDSLRNGVERQAETLSWGLQAAYELETAGLTVYSWSDRWWNAGMEVFDWKFGLLDRDGIAKPSLAAISRLPISHPQSATNFFSIIVCSRNGRERIGNCLTAIHRMKGGDFETIVVDDGSSDDTADFVAKNFPWARLLRLAPSGLSAARNAGAAIAQHDLFAFTDDDCEPDEEWITRLRRAFQNEAYAAIGGPNLPPPPRTWEEAVVCAAPGAPSHVMLGDEEAEHLPGCNLAVRKSAFDAIGGFDSRFQTAGDDVDFCWRLREAGFRLGFAPGAFVWHWRRPSVWQFLRQQLGYGRAERLLLGKHPHRFTDSGDAKWHGFIYGGGPVRVMEDSIIHYGSMGDAGYQQVTNRMLPLRGLVKHFSHWKAHVALTAVNLLQPILRAWPKARMSWWKYGKGLFTPLLAKLTKDKNGLKTSFPDEFVIHSDDGKERDYFLNLLIDAGWKPAGETDAWDLEKGDARILMATERGEGIAKQTLIRVWGNIEKTDSLFQRRQI